MLATTQRSAQERLTIETIHLPDLTAIPAADLVYAGYSLPYIHPDDFARVWGLIRSSLRPGAWFAGNFFGDRDSWADDPDETSLSEEAARALFEGMEIVSFNEEDEDGQADSGPKQWHVFNVIAHQPRVPT